MTIDDFLTALQEIRSAFTWVGLEGTAGIRGRKPDTTSYPSTYCPLTAVCLVKTGEVFGIHQASEAGRALGLKHEDINQIIAGADFLTTHPTLQPIRTRLQSALKGE